MPETQTSSPYVYLIALFLSEIIRSRRTTIQRAAEISKRAVDESARIQSEEEMLRFVTELEKEFEEVSSLRLALHFNYQNSDVNVYEREIKDYAAQLFTQDMALSAAFLQDAAKAGVTIQELCLRYPNFCNYLTRVPEKAALVGT